MARKRKGKAKPWTPRGTQQGRKVSPVQEEMIVQQYSLCGNMAEVARQMGLSYPVISRVIKAAEKTPALQQARSRALEDIAGRVHKKTDDILESITPEDMESGLIKTFDKEGRLIAAKSYGPSLMQKVTSAAILTDKLKVIQETKNALLQDQAADPNGLPLPGDVRTALKQIGDRVKRLRVIDIQLADNQPELANKIQEVAHKASLDEGIEDAEFEELDFDNPGA